MFGIISGFLTIEVPPVLIGLIIDGDYIINHPALGYPMEKPLKVEMKQIKFHRVRDL